MAADGHLLIILHLVPGQGDLRRRAAIFWRAPDGTWKATGEAKGNITALRSHVESFAKALADLEARVGAAKSASEYFDAVRALGPIHRTALHMHKALQEARDASSDPDIITLRDQAGDLERSAELLYEDAKHGLDYTIARRAEEQATRAHAIERSGHRLNRLAAVFLPVSALGGAFSMKFASGLEDVHAPWLFWGIFLAAFALGLSIRAAIGAEEPTRS